MNSSVTEVKATVGIDDYRCMLKDGTYDGVWGGYIVNFSAEGVDYELKTKVGIRTMSARCKITVCDGGISVEST